MNYSTMFDWVFDAIDNGMQLVVANEWYEIFCKVCSDFKIDYDAEVHEGFRLVTRIVKS